MIAAAEPLELRSVRLRNRLVATAHASGLVQDGLPVAGDAEYWGRLAAGGAAMLIGGGTVTAPESAPRRGNILEAWRADAVEPLRRRVDAIHAEGGVAVCQLVHLGRETLGADSYYSPIAPSAIRSPREPTAPRAMLEREVAAMVDGFRVSAANSLEAGFDGIELHAAHAYLLEQFLSPRTNHRGDGTAVLERVIEAIRRLSDSALLGIRLSIDASEDVALELDELADLLGVVDPLVDWVNVTVGVRTTYVRDMATTRPPVLDELARLRPMVRGPLLVSHAFRHPDWIDEALASRRRPGRHGAPADRRPRPPAQALRGPTRRDTAVRRLQRGLPHVRPAAAVHRQPRPGASGGAAAACRAARARAGPRPLGRRPRRRGRRRSGRPGVRAQRWPARAWRRSSSSRPPTTSAVSWRSRPLRRTAPAGRRCWTSTRAGSGARASSCASGRRRRRWTTFDAVVLATGAEEIVPAGALASSAVIASGPQAMSGAAHVIVVDDGFGWWPAINVVELALAAGAGRVTLVTPGTAFAGGIPAESRVQLVQRLAGAGDLQIVPLSSATEITAGGVTLVESVSRRSRLLEGDRVVVAGERRPRATPTCAAPLVLAIGDAIVPRRAAHAIAEGRAAAARIAAAVRVPQLS